MSGGHYNYLHFRVEELASEIERDFVNDGKYKNADLVPNKEYDRIGDATPEQRIIILSEIKNLIKDLKECSFRAQRTSIVAVPHSHNTMLGGL